MGIIFILGRVRHKWIGHNLMFDISNIKRWLKYGTFCWSYILEVWRLALLCLMWCIWREWNAWRFEDIETSVLELKRIMFYALYTWIAAHHSFFCFVLFFFFKFVFFFLLIRGILLYTSCVLGCAPICFSNGIELLIKNLK
jgi:hypothetical protein